MRRANLIAVPALVVGVMFGVAPLASANPTGDHTPTPTPRASQFDSNARDWTRPCRPEHTGRSWTWHDTRRGGHWDYTVGRRTTRHLWWDRTYCAPRVTANDRDRDRDRTRVADRDRFSRDAVDTRDGRSNGRDGRDGRDDSRDRGRDRDRDNVRQLDRDTNISISDRVRERVG